MEAICGTEILELTEAEYDYIILQREAAEQRQRESVVNRFTGIGYQCVSIDPMGETYRKGDFNLSIFHLWQHNAIELSAGGKTYSTKLLPGDDVIDVIDVIGKLEAALQISL